MLRFGKPHFTEQGWKQLLLIVSHGTWEKLLLLKKLRLLSVHTFSGCNLDDGDEVAWHTYKGQLTEKQEKTRDKIIKRILFLLKIADPSGEADQKRDSRVKDKKPDKAEVPVSATKKQPPTQGTKEK
uniref:Uncharacterized protein n=1 Tax=Populus alba TaxID=43335 RepID=A0A4U5MW18_POPAL|nr:hypothetical protein D5086_0000299400 [Populus alba]